MITTVAEHKVDLDLLPSEANVLDLGARGFQFCKEMRSLGYKVVPVDIDKIEGLAYHQVAISDYNGRAGIKHSNDPQATQIVEGNEVPCYTLESFIEHLGIEFDLIKMDVESSEWQIIKSLEKAPATFLSIEFHLHTGIYTKYEVKLMVTKLKSLGYEVLSHELTEAHGAGKNYWSSLFMNTTYGKAIAKGGIIA